MASYSHRTRTFSSQSLVVVAPARRSSPNFGIAPRARAHSNRERNSREDPGERDVSSRTCPSTFKASFHPGSNVVETSRFLIPYVATSFVSTCVLFSDAVPSPASSFVVSLPKYVVRVV